ncbi:MAG: MFS transporter [Hyphomonadaceae bacterium]|nr:MFS transporter [Hyphomonadaceae bacterium]
MAPYISNVVVGDPIRGQEIISSWHKTSGLIVALSAPFVGATADAMGRRKPLLAALTLVLAAAIAAQWWALPNEQGLPLATLGAIVIVASVSFVWTEVLHNAMLTNAAPSEGVSRLSGFGLSLGNASSVLLLVGVLWAFALPGTMNLPLLPERALFGLDPNAHEPSRVVTILCAVWLLAFSVPLFAHTPDLVSTGRRFGDSVASGVMSVARTLRKLRDHRNIAIFLLARMFYADGKTAILIFSGVYASGVMGWGLIEMLAYGVILSLFAVVGGFVSAALDRTIGAKLAVASEIGVTLACLVTMVSVSPTTIFFSIAIDSADRLWSAPFFNTLPQAVYLGASLVIAISITAAYASSRALMARLSPPAMAGELFGLYALAASATAWLGPMLVETFTHAYESQRAGFASIALLLVVGLALLLFVRPPKSA